MRRVVVAAAVGLVASLAVTWAVTSTSAGAPEAAPAAGAAEAARATPNEASAPAAQAQRRSRPGLHVTVRDGAALAPGAVVSAWLQRADDAKGGVRWLAAGREVTDAAGLATFPAVPGRYAVLAEQAGGRTGVAVADVVIADEPSYVTVSLAADRAVTGQVVDAQTNAPVPGALVTAVGLSARTRGAPWRLPAETHLTVPADSLGRFRVDVPQALGALLLSSAPGYAQGDGAPVDADETPAPLTLKLVRAATAAGVVVDGRGQPMSGAVVRSEPAEAPATTSDEAGRFTLTLAPGAATVHAVSRDGLQGLTRVRAAPGDRLADVRVTVAAAGDLLGRVVDARGLGLSGVEVRVLAEPDAVEVALVQTADDGAFRAVQLPAGRYSLFARAGSGGRTRQVGVELPQAAPVTLTLAAAAALAGQVVNEAGQPLPNALVTLSWSKGLDEPDVSARSDAQGRFELVDLWPAVVSARATLGESASEDVEVVLQAGATASTSLTLQRRGRLKGRVLSPTPQRFFIFPKKVPGGDMKHGFPTDDQGRYDEQLVPGRYELFASSPTLLMTRFNGLPVEVYADETTQVDLPVELDDSPEVPNAALHPRLGSGLSFEAGPGGVAVSFVMGDCPAALAGVKQGDLVSSIGGEPVTKTLDAFAKLDRPRGESMTMTVRREGRDLTLTLK